jgi:hypothetical protein
MSDVTTPVRGTGSCVLCNRPDTLDLRVCLNCASRTGDGLLFVRQSMRRAERARIVEDLHRILPPGVEWEAFNLAAKGFLPLASVPLRAVEPVVGALAHGGVPALLTPKRWGVAPIPPSLGFLLLSVVMVGSFVGLLSGQLLFFGSPLYAGLLWMLAQFHLRRPAACGGKSDSWLPSDVEERLVTALMSLPAGNPRTLLSDAVRLGRLLWERAEATGDVDIVENTSELLALAADAATDLARGPWRPSKRLARDSTTFSSPRCEPWAARTNDFPKPVVTARIWPSWPTPSRRVASPRQSPTSRWSGCSRSLGRPSLPAPTGQLGHQRRLHGGTVAIIGFEVVMCGSR